MKCRLFTQLPKVKDYGIGVINVMGHDHEALFMDKSGEEILAEMSRVQLIGISINGIHLSGFEKAGADKQHRVKYVYQEWYLSTEFTE